MKLLKKIVLVWGLMCSFSGLSQAQEVSAVETAEVGVKTLLQTVAASKSYFVTDRDRYFNDVETVLNSFVDFTAVAQVVMNRFASSASPEQTQRFADILRNTLTRFYGASLVSYEGQELVFLPASNSNSDPRADTVVGMELRGGDTNLRIQYQMFINADNQWKLKNLSLAGINLGRQYNTQFAALMSKHDNNIDLVLDNWQ